MDPKKQAQRQALQKLVLKPNIDERMYLESKKEKGNITPEQIQRLNALKDAELQEEEDRVQQKLQAMTPEQRAQYWLDEQRSLGEEYRAMSQPSAKPTPQQSPKPAPQQSPKPAPQEPGILEKLKSFIPSLPKPTPLFTEQDARRYLEKQGEMQKQQRKKRGQ